MSYRVDTNVISELTQPAPNPGVLRWAESVARHSVSAITVEEIWYGIARHPNARLYAWMENYLSGQDVLSTTGQIARRAGELRGDLYRRGIIRLQADILIAATAQIYGLTLVTRNFEECGIGILNPFCSI